MGVSAIRRAGSLDVRHVPTGYGDACARWFAGIDVAEWLDGSNRSKDIDFLIYDKVRWNHSELEVKLLRPVQGEPERARTANTYYTLQAL